MANLIGTAPNQVPANADLGSAAYINAEQLPVSDPQQSALDNKVTKVVSTDNAIVRFDGTTGSVQNSTAILDASGNLGLGVVPSAWVSSRKALQIGGSTVANVTYGAQIGESAYNCYVDSGGTGRYLTSNPGGYISFNNSAAGGFAFGIAPSGTAGNPITFTQAMTLDASGNLGVGTSSPTQKLHVRQDQAAYTWGRFDNQSSSASAYAGIQVGAFGNTWGIAIGSSAANNNALTFVLDAGGTNSEKMRLDASGHLLVGTTSKIDGRVSINADTSNSGCIGTSNNGLSTYYPAIFYHSGVLRGYIGTSGTGTTYNTSSDYRLKENVQPMTNALDKISALKPVTYNWKVDGSADRGFIAHELQEVIPQAVSGEKDAVDDKGNIMPQGVDYGKITPEIVAALQEAYAIITELKTRIEQLENK